MRPDLGEYNYNLDPSRAYAGRAAASPMNPGVPYGQDLPGMGSSESLGSYRHNSAGYPYSSKQYYAAVPWPQGYTEDPIDYNGLNYHPYAYLGTNDAGHLYRMPTGPPKSTLGANLYADPEPAYTYAASSATLVHRPAASSESQNFSFSNVAASLPSALSSSSDRLLPNPAVRTLGSSQIPYRTDGALPPYSSAGSKSISSTANTSPTSVISEDTAGYGSYDGSPVSPVSSYNPPTATLPSMANRIPEPYTTSETIFSPAEASLRGQGAGSDSAYHYGDSSRRDSSTSVQGGALSNGQAYTVPLPTHSQSSTQGLHGHSNSHSHGHVAGVPAPGYMMTGGAAAAVAVAAAGGDLSGATTADRSRGSGSGAGNTAGGTSQASSHRASAGGLRAA
jgi:hypothetical protein